MEPGSESPQRNSGEGPQVDEEVTSSPYFSNVAVIQGSEDMDVSSKASHQAIPKLHGFRFILAIQNRKLTTLIKGKLTFALTERSYIIKAIKCPA